MEKLKDDPIVASMIRNGYPPWENRKRILTPFGYEDDEEWEEEDADVFYGNETEAF